MEKKHQSKQQPDTKQRKISSSILTFYSFQGAQIRKIHSSDARYAYYVDLYSPQSLLAFFTIMFLSILDGHFTLNLVAMGVSELNPLMDMLIHTSIPSFWFCKLYLTVFGLYLLLMNKHVYFPGMKLGVKHIVVMIIGMYTIIVSGEIFMLSQL